jgi:hypothetical protein
MLKLVKMYRKNQITVELIIVSALVLAIFLTLFAIIEYRNNEISSSKRYFNAKDTAEEIAWGINEVYISGFNTRKTMYVVNTTFDLEPLNIKILPNSRLVVVEWGTNFYTAPLVTSRIKGNISGDVSYNITLQMGELRISNTMGEINVVQ